MIKQLLVVLAVILVSGCNPSSTPSTQIVVVGESFASGAEAAQEVNNFIANAAASGCKAISVGGYAAGGEGLVIGIPVLLDCPLGTAIITTGVPVP